MKGHLFPGERKLRRDTVRLHGRLNLGATGAITTQTKQRFSGFVAARTGVGTYTLTCSDKYSELLNFNINIIGANATYAAASGFGAFVTSDLITTTKVITIQFRRTDTGANAEVENNAKVLIDLELAQAQAEVG
jgi:hypothetical protein